MKPMIEPIGWLITLKFVATDACWREDECVRAPLLFLYNVLLNSEYKFLWVARWCVREVPRDRFNGAFDRNSRVASSRLVFFSDALNLSLGTSRTPSLAP